jgi:hypothetical protein
VKSGVYYVVTWFDYRNFNQADIYVQQMNSSGAVQWMTDGVQLCGAAGHQFNPRLASDQIGGAIVTWEDGAGFDIYAGRILRAVQWSSDGRCATRRTNRRLRRRRRALARSSRV